MTLSEIAHKIQQAVQSNKTLVFDNQLLDSSDIGKILSEYFTNGAITISGTDVSLNDGIQITGFSTYAEVSNVPIRISLNGTSSTDLICTLSLNLTDGWTMPELFSDILDQHIASLSISKAKLVLYSGTQGSIDGTYEAPVLQGLNLIGTLDATKSIPQWAPILSNAHQLVIYGLIQNNTLPLFHLQTVPINCALGPFSLSNLSFTFSIKNISKESGTPIAYPSYALLGSILIGKDIKGDFKAKLAAQSPLIKLELNFDKTTLNGLSDLSTLIGAENPLEALPVGVKDAIQEAGNSFELVSAMLLFDLSAKHLVQCSVSFSTELNNYKIFNPLPNIEIKRLDLLFGISFGSKTTITYRAKAAVELGDFNGTLGFQTQPGNGFIINMLQNADSSVPLDQLLNTFLPSQTLIPSIAVENFGVTIDPTIGNYSVLADLKGSWNILDQPEIRLDEVSFSGNYFASGSQVTGSLLGRLNLQVDPQDTSKDIRFSVNAQKSNSGWSLLAYGDQAQVIPVGDLVVAINNLFGSGRAVPRGIRELKISMLNLTYETDSSGSAFSFECGIKTTICAQQITLNLLINTVKNGAQYTNSFHLRTLVGSCVFSGELISGDQNNSITFSWNSDHDKHLTLDMLTKWLGLPVPSVPSDLEISLKSASFSYDFDSKQLVLTADSANYGKATLVALNNPTTKAWQFFFGLATGAHVNLSNLPLVDKVLPPDQQIAVENLQVLLASAPLNPNKDQYIIQAINHLVPAGYPNIPATGIAGKVALSADLSLGGSIVPLNVAIGNEKKPPESIHLVNATSGSTPHPTNTEKSTAANTHWFNIQKSFGPVSFQKIGVSYDDGVLWFLLDASLSAAGLEISLNGLSVGTPLSTFEPQFNIEGLGLNYSNTALTIGGSFEKMTPKHPVTLEFGGAAVLQTKEFAISALGSYAQFDGHTSMFVFASMNKAFGGPAFFFVTGLCGGFGYNSKLRIPEQDEVFEFPFVASLSNPNLLGANPTPSSVLQQVMGGNKPWVTPELGTTWLGVGLQFNTYKVIDSTALLVAEFGAKPIYTLLGLSRARFPMQGKDTDTYAFVELQLKASLDPEEGKVLFTAVLSPNSYVLDPACHLTGGFAMAYWFGDNPHAGDFVLTMGGYSPYFTPPAHYPKEPRLAFDWTMDGSVTISGDAYFALTPAAIMAGGNLSVTYHSGNLNAWFTAHADIIVWYNPFHFIAQIGVSVGASYTVDFWFTSQTFTVELGADLTLWGPPTGGTVTVHWWVISFTVNFGSDLSTGMEKQTWEEFTKVLPTKENIVKYLPVKGLHTTSKNSGADTWVVRPDHFVFDMSSVIPVTEITNAGTSVAHGSKLNIKPMQETELTATNNISIISEETGKDILKDKLWTIEPRKTNVPSALWGTGSNTALSSGDSLITDQLTGCRVTAPMPHLGPIVGPVDQTVLEYDPLSPGSNPLRTGLPSTGPVARKSVHTISLIAQTMSPTVLSKRNAVAEALSAFGLEQVTNGKLPKMATNAGKLFVNEPLVI